MNNMNEIVVEDIYKIEDWTSATKMKNYINSDRKLEVEVLLDENGEPDGHRLTIVENEKVIGSFCIECSDETVYSLTVSEAIEMLNGFGYNCYYDPDRLVIPQEARDLLQQLYDLGYRYIVRDRVPTKYKYIDFFAWKRGHSCIRTFVCTENVHQFPEYIARELAIDIDRILAYHFSQHKLQFLGIHNFYEIESLLALED